MMMLVELINISPRYILSCAFISISVFSIFSLIHFWCTQPKVCCCVVIVMIEVEDMKIFL